MWLNIVQKGCSSFRALITYWLDGRGERSIINEDIAMKATFFNKSYNQIPMCVCYFSPLFNTIWTKYFIVMPQTTLSDQINIGFPRYKKDFSPFKGTYKGSSDLFLKQTKCLFLHIILSWEKVNQNDILKLKISFSKSNIDSALLGDTWHLKDERCLSSEKSCSFASSMSAC